MFEEDPFGSPGGTWSDQHGNDHTKWPLPDGQPMTWKEWAQELSAEAIRRGFQPTEDFFPWTDEDIKWAVGTCWLDDWVIGKTPKEAIDEQYN